MRLGLTLALLAALMASSSIAESEFVETGNKQFSPLVAKDLFGQKVRIPRDLKSSKSCVIVAFEREQQSIIDTWIPFFSNLEKEKSDFKFYEVPVIQAGYKPVRWFIDGAMAKSIRNSEGKKRTLTSYTNVSKFVKTMGLDNRQITIFLIANDGTILAREDGEYKKEKAERLSSEIEKTSAAK